MHPEFLTFGIFSLKPLKFPPCSIYYIAMIGQVLLLPGYTRKTTHNPVWQMQELYLPSIILNLEHIISGKQWDIVIRPQLWVIRFFEMYFFKKSASDTLLQVLILYINVSEKWIILWCGKLCSVYFVYLFACFHSLQVSNSYSREVSGHGAIAPHLGKFYGILNGIDPDIWDPYSDKFIPVNFVHTNIAFIIIYLLHL